jgi:predicted acylesterase/phospholipase RssA
VGVGRFRSRFVVDIISGTSAGGLNGVFLATALANDTPRRPRAYSGQKTGILFRKSQTPCTVPSFTVTLKEGLDLVWPESASSADRSQGFLTGWVTSRTLVTDGLKWAVSLGGGARRDPHSAAFRLR